MCSSDLIFFNFQLDASGFIVLLLLALISHAAGQGLNIWTLAHLSASISSLTLLIQPVVAAILVWVLFAESLTVTQIAGTVLVLAAIPLASRSSRRVTNAS